MTLDANRPVPSHDDNVETVRQELDSYIINHSDMFDPENFLPDDVDPMSMSATALRDAMQPQVHAVSADLISGLADSPMETVDGETGVDAAVAYAAAHDVTPEEVIWIMNMSQSIMCYITHMNDMAQDRVGAMATDAIPNDHPLKRSMTGGRNLPPGLSDLIARAIAADMGGIEMIDLTDGMPGMLDLGPDADPDSIPPDERL